MDKSNKSIIFVTITMTGGGTERVIATLANHWVQKGIDVTILMIGGDTVAYDLDDRVEISSISGVTNGNGFARMRRIRALRGKFKENRNSAIIAMGTVASIFASIASAGMSNTLILSERNDPNRLNHRPIKAYERIVRNILYSRADHIVFQTETALRCFPKRIKKKSLIIMNPLQDGLPEPNELSARSKTVITAGRLTEQKNHKMLIDAFCAFHEKKDEYLLYIFGEGELYSVLKEYIQKKHAEKFVFLKGFSGNIISEMNNSQIYVSSSDWEGISNSLMEAMAMGMIVIATDCPVGGNGMLIRDGINGRLINVGRTDELTDALLEASNPTVSDEYSDNARKIRVSCSAKCIADKWEEIVGDI